MGRTKKTLLTLALGGLGLMLAAYLAACAATSEGMKPAETAAQPAAAAVAAAEPVDIFAVEVKPLTVADCARCHPHQYNSLKTDGRKHRFDCQNCHEVFHAYNPTKNNFAEIMPKCGTCHTLPHGQRFKECLQCHQNPHTPRQVSMGTQLSGNCGNCHTEPAGQLKEFPSKHTQQGCETCHDKHGYKPSCSACHEPHYEAQEFTACTGCHSVHKPLQIAFTEETDLKTCGGCHSDVYQKWSTTKAKHGEFSCTMCHGQHGLVPECTDCHGQPHSAALHAKYTNCLTCHINPHDLPVQNK